MDKSSAINLLKNTFIDYTLIDGTTVKLTLAFYLLKQLESKNPSLSDRYYKTTSKKQSELRDIDTVTIIYTAYCCANLDNEELMDEDVFMILMGGDRLSMNGIVQRLVGAKKNPSSVTRS